MRTARLLLILLPLVALSGPFAVSEEPPPPAPPPELAERLPADTILYARIRSLAEAWKGFQTLSLHAAWQDEEMQDFLDASSEGLGKAIADAGGDRGLLEKLLALPETFPGEAAFAWIDAAEESDWAFSLTGDPEKAKAFAKEVVRPLLDSASFGEATSSTIAGVEVTAFHGPHRTLLMAVADDRLLIVSGEALLGRLLRAPKDGEETLARQEAFRRAREKVGRGLSLFVYHAFSASVATWAKEGGEPQQRFMAASGLDGLTTIAAGLRMADGRARETIWFDVPGGRRGFLAVYPGTLVDLDAARLAPASTFAFLSASIRPSDVYRVVAKLAENEKSDLAEFLRDLEESLGEAAGVRALADLVGFFGTEVFLFSSLPGGGGPIPEFAAAIEVIQPDRLQMTIDALVRTHAGTPPKMLKYRNREIRYVKAELDNIDIVGGLLTPCWCLTDGYLLVSHHPTILKGIIRRLEGEGGKTLLDDEAFRRARESLPEGTVAAGYLSTERLFRWLYGLVLPFISAADDQLPFDTAALPTADAIAQHLSFALTALTLEEKGLRLQTDSDGYGPTSLALYGSLVGLLVAAPWSENADALETHPACGDNLDTLHDLIDERRMRVGHYPKKLTDLEDEHLGWRGWSARCPLAQQVRTGKGKGFDSDERHWGDFEYWVEVKGGEPPKSLPADMMLVWDAVARHNGGRIVVHVDGRVTWLREEAFRKALEAQRKR